MNDDGSVHFLNLEYFFRLIYEAIFGTAFSWDGITRFFYEIWSIVVPLGYLATVFLLGWLVYSTVRTYQVRKLEEEKYGPLPTPTDDPKVEHNKRWEHVVSLMDSENASDWRQAIIEADILLFDMLTSQGYAGESIGEKLKQIDRADFATLDYAWEAHKVRNEIAHTGAGYTLTPEQARRTIGRFEQVFREFHLI